jgi:sortase (surface protein transpeptidase)
VSRIWTGVGPGRRALIAGAVGLGVTGIVLLSVGIGGVSRALPAPAPSAAAVRGTVATPPTAPTATPLSTVHSVPLQLRIPAIDLSVALTTLGENPDGSVQVPSNDREPGWFRLGPTPGELGSAVILGHVDNTLGPGIFFNLRSLAAGDPVFVDRADGSTVEFVVDSVASYPRADFPAQRVYGFDGSSALQLVTCGGVFDHATGSYLSNIVVYTSLVKVMSAAVPAG